MAINILVTEDESIVRKDIEQTLEKIGYNVVASADNGEDAIDLAATRNTPRLPTFDMVEDVRDLAEKMLLVKETNGIATQVKSLLNTVKNYSTKARQFKQASEADELDDKDRALAVVYGNLTVSTFKLAEALARFSPRLGEVNEDGE